MRRLVKNIGLSDRRVENSSRKKMSSVGAFVRGGSNFSFCFPEVFSISLSPDLRVIWPAVVRMFSYARTSPSREWQHRRDPQQVDSPKETFPSTNHDDPSSKGRLDWLECYYIKMMTGGWRKPETRMDISNSFHHDPKQKLVSLFGVLYRAVTFGGQRSPFGHEQLKEKRLVCHVHRSLIIGCPPTDDRIENISASKWFRSMFMHQAQHKVHRSPDAVWCPDTKVIPMQSYNQRNVYY